jgi:hypothetical protein
VEMRRKEVRLYQQLPIGMCIIDPCRVNVRSGLVASFWSLADYFRSSPANGHRQGWSACLTSANTGLGRCDHLIDFAPYGKCTADQAI